MVKPIGSMFASRSRRAVLLVVVLAAVSILGAYAYEASLPSHEGPRASIVSPPVEFSVEMNKPDFALGENVTVSLSVKNTSNSTIQLNWGSYSGSDGRPMHFDFCITDINDTVIYQFGRWHMWLAVKVSKVLKPGEQLTSVFIWWQRGGSEPSSEVPVPKGTYFLRGLTRRVRLAVDGQTTEIELETPTITFTVT